MKKSRTRHRDRRKLRKLRFAAFIMPLLWKELLPRLLEQIAKETHASGENLLDTRQSD